VGRVMVVQDNYARWFFTRIGDDGEQQGTSSAFATREAAVEAAQEQFPDDNVIADGVTSGADSASPVMPKVEALTEADTMGLTH
jgi:hypothetical protein